MHVAYLAYVSPGDVTGVPEKVVSMARALREHCEVSVLWVSHEPGARLSSGTYEGQLITAKSRVGRILASLSSSTTLLGWVRRGLTSLRPDVVYLRHPLFRPGLAPMLHSIAPYVMEINGNPYPELVLQGRKIVAVLDRWFGRGLFRYASGFVGVTEESVAYATARAKRPSVVIGNGVDCDEVRFLEHRVEGPRVHVAYVGSPSVYDGLDRLWIALASNRMLASKIVLHIIGSGWEVKRSLERAAQLAEVRVYGYVRSHELPGILSLVDIGLGPLGLHRRGLMEAANLKVRRYLAHGIPVVLGSDDPDLKGSLPFVLKIEPNDQPVDLDALVRFGMKARSLQLRRQAREYAEAHLSYRVKARGLLAFLKGVSLGSRDSLPG